MIYKWAMNNHEHISIANISKLWSCSLLFISTYGNYFHPFSICSIANCEIYPEIPRGYVEKIGNNHENLWFFWGLSNCQGDLDSYYSTKSANTSSGMGCLRSRQCWRTRNHHELDLLRSFHGTSGLLNIHYSIPWSCGKCKTMQNQHVAVAQKNPMVCIWFICPLQLASTIPLRSISLRSIYS